MSNFQEIFGQSGFETGSCAPQLDYEALPPGKYVVSIEKSEVKATKAQNGHYLELTMCVLEGNFKNRKLWDRINIDNPSQQCVQIGRSVLAAIGLALEVPSLLAAEQLVGGVLVAHVKVKGEQNEIRTYSSVAKYRADQAVAVAQGGQAVTTACAPPAQQQPPQQQQPVQPQQPGQQASPQPASVPPWQRQN